MELQDVQNHGGVQSLREIIRIHTKLTVGHVMLLDILGKLNLVFFDFYRFILFLYIDADMYFTCAGLYYIGIHRQCLQIFNWVMSFVK